MLKRQNIDPDNDIDKYNYVQDLQKKCLNRNGLVQAPNNTYYPPDSCIGINDTIGIVGYNLKFQFYTKTLGSKGPMVCIEGM